MSFPPNLGITNSLLLDTDYYLIFQELPSILPTLNQIPSPFPRNRMTINGYSRIHSTKRSKSVDFADLTYAHHTPRSAPKITTVRDSIPEHGSEECAEEVSGTGPGKKCSVSSEACDPAVIRRSASISEGYSRIHHKGGSGAEDDDDDDQYGSGLVTKKRSVKKKGKFFGAVRRFFGL